MISIDSTAMKTNNFDLANLSQNDTALEIRNLDLRYGNKQALFNVSMKIPKKQVTAFIGPSGCGKSTLLRCINRMNDLVDNCHIDGEILLHGQNIYDKKIDVAALRRNVGMVLSLQFCLLLACLAGMWLADLRRLLRNLGMMPAAQVKLHNGIT